MGVGMSYPSVLLMIDAWTVYDLQHCIKCLVGIAEKQPGVIIVDNDDFHTDTLAGANTSHRTDVMYVQKTPLEHCSNLFGKRIKNAKVLSSTLKDMTSKLQSYDRYLTHRRREPPISDKVNSKVGGFLKQRKCGVIHTLVRTNNSGERPAPSDQKVSSYSGFHSLISPPVEKSNAYYFITYSDQPKNQLSMKFC